MLFFLVTGDQEQPEPRVAAVQSVSHFPVQLRRGQEAEGALVNKTKQDTRNDS